MEVIKEFVEKLARKVEESRESRAFVNRHERRKAESEDRKRRKRPQQSRVSA